MAAIRINVIGASGSGASTVGRALASSLSIDHFDGDDYYHAPSVPPFQNPRSPDERCEMMRRDLAPTRSWVLSGGVMGWSPLPELDFTCVVFLYVPTEARIERLRRREGERFGSRIGVGGDMHVGHKEFIEWAASYDGGEVEGKTLARHEAFLAAQNCPVIEVRGVYSVPAITEKVLSFIGAA